MKRKPSHSRSSAANPSVSDGNPEYIRRLEGRLQETSLFLRACESFRLCKEPEAVLASLVERLTSAGGLGFRTATVRCSDGAGENGGNGTTGGGPAGTTGGASVREIPIAAGDTPLGSVLVGPADPATPEDTIRLACAESLVEAAGAAIAAIRLEMEAARSAILLDTLEETGAKAVSAARLEEALRLMVRAAVQATGSGWGLLWLYEEATDRLRLAASFGTETSGCEDPVQAAISAAESAVRKRTAIEATPGGDTLPGTPILVLPLFGLDQPLGAIALAGRTGAPGGPAPAAPAAGGADRAFVRTLAAQASMAILHARLSDQVRESNRRLQEVQRILLQTEKLAALGEMSAKVAHEIRNPLSAIGGFARRIEKGLPQEDPNRQYASIVVREIQRLETLLTEQLLFAQTAGPRLAAVDLNAVTRETVQLIHEELEGAKVALLAHYDGTIPSMLLDGDRVKQVILNILKNALASTHQGNQIRVRTRAADGWAQIEIANDGDRLPGEILEQIFVPFATSRNRGCGLGLAVADQIVKEHGGEIRVRSTEEWSVVFTVSLPIRTNSDRRQSADRRKGRDRRRAA